MSITPRFKIGTRFIRRKTKRQDVETIIDIYTTTNSKGEIVRIRYVAELDFMGQAVIDFDVYDSTIALSKIVK